MATQTKAPATINFPVFQTANGNYLAEIEHVSQGDMVGLYYYMYFTKEGEILKFTDEDEFQWLSEKAETVESPIPKINLQGILEDYLRSDKALESYPPFTSSYGTILVAELGEICDCGSHIRHNNGGNYHGTWQIVFRPETGRFEEWVDSTSEFASEEMLAMFDDPQEYLEGYKQKEGEGYYLDIHLDDMPEYDYEKLRRRVRDALNKTAENGAIVRCALELGVKLNMDAE